MLDSQTLETINHGLRQGDPGAPVVLTLVLAEDWFLYARDREGSVYQLATEMWEEWLDLPESIELEQGKVKKYMVPVAWNKGYFQHREWWDKLADDETEGIPTATIDGLPAFWDVRPEFPMPKEFSIAQAAPDLKPSPSFHDPKGEALKPTSGFRFS